MLGFNEFLTTDVAGLVLSQNMICRKEIKDYKNVLEIAAFVQPDHDRLTANNMKFSSSTSCKNYFSH
jgi:hypothetical protein